MFRSRALLADPFSFDSMSFQILSERQIGIHSTVRTLTKQIIKKKRKIEVIHKKRSARCRQHDDPVPTERLWGQIRR